MLKHKILLILFLFISTSLIYLNYLPKIFSRQDLINPDNIQDQFDQEAQTATFNNKKIIIPENLLAANATNNNVLGENSENKRIEVDLTKQQLYGYEGNNLVYSFTISSGKWDRTPTGDFKIWTKIRSQKMSGGSKELGTYYYLPNVPYVLFFYNDKTPKKLGYSLHGTYWHNNFGVPMSHGCINMKTPEAAQIFSWAEMDTPITIYGKYQYKTASR